MTIRKKKEMTELRQNLILNLQRYKERNHLSYPAMAEKFGLSMSLVYKFIKQDSDLRLEDVEAIAEVMNVDPIRLFRKPRKNRQKKN